VEKLIDMISSPYAAFVADDDFYVPSALDQCVQFLEENPDYSAAHGLGTLVTVENNEAHGPVKGAGYFKQPNIEDEAASSRFVSLFQNYSVPIFSVHRQETWQNMYEHAASIPDWWHFGSELIECSRSVIAGKVKQLDCLQMIRQVHQPLPASVQSTGSGSVPSLINISATAIGDPFDWVSNHRWAPSYEEFSRLISEDLARKDNIDVEQSKRLVKEVFWKYLSETLDSKWYGQFSRNGRRPESLSRRAAGALPGVPWLFNRWKSFRGNLDKRLSVEAMLRPSSDFHENFMPIYRAITESAPTPVS
jgi:hypothetical protein